MSCGPSVLASIGALKLIVIGAVVEKPSSPLMVAAFGRNGSPSGRRSVPSVDPWK